MSKNKKGKDKNVKEIEITDENTVSEQDEYVTKNELADEHSEEESTDEKLTQLEEEVSELKDKLLRKAAEFENYKRRSENDQMNLLTYAAESFIQKLLPVIDDFERSLDHINDAQDVEAIKKGLKLIYDKFIKILDDQGVKKIKAVGEPFDVEFHEALSLAVMNLRRCSNHPAERCSYCGTIHRRSKFFLQCSKYLSVNSKLTGCTHLRSSFHEHSISASFIY